MVMDIPNEGLTEVQTCQAALATDRQEHIPDKWTDPDTSHAYWIVDLVKYILVCF